MCCSSRLCEESFRNCSGDQVGAIAAVLGASSVLAKGKELAARACPPTQPHKPKLLGAKRFTLNPVVAEAVCGCWLGTAGWQQEGWC